MKCSFTAACLIVAVGCGRSSSNRDSDRRQHSSSAVGASSRAAAHRESSLTSDVQSVARRVSAHADVEIPKVRVRLGDGFGCAQHHDGSYECWSARAAGADDASGSAPELTAHALPWLDGKRIAIGPDRLCVAESTQWRCFRAPELIEHRDSSLASAPESTESWLVPMGSEREAALTFDLTPVTHGIGRGCSAGYCWGAVSALAPACQLGSIWVPCFSAAPIVADTTEAFSLSPAPSACQIDELGQLWCRGAGYSRDTRGQLPVRVRSSPPHAFVAWDARGQFHLGCAIHHDCGRSLRILPRCSAGTRAFTVHELLGLAVYLDGTRVAVRGDLTLSPVIWSGLSGIRCGPSTTVGKPSPEAAHGGGSDAFCCPAEGDAPVLIASGRQSLPLDGSWCYGDSSRACCSLPVFGQAVIASGVLGWREASVGVREGWVLTRPELCQVE